MIEDLTQKFHSMSEDEQRAFLVRVMPAVRRLFLSDHEKMMVEIMPFCREMMSKPGCDMNGMAEMMSSSKKR